MFRTLTLTALVVVLAGTMARAQATAGSAPVNDWLFAQAAAASGLAEVAISEIGMERATDPELKKLSQMMVHEHSRLNQELKTLAAQKRVALPQQVDVRAQYCVQSLRGASRETFDRCYAKAQLNLHTEAVAAFEAEAERGRDADMKAFAAKALPRIKEHLKTIKPIAEKFEKEHPTEGEKETKETKETKENRK